MALDSLQLCLIRSTKGKSLLSVAGQADLPIWLETGTNHGHCGDGYGMAPLLPWTSRDVSDDTKGGFPATRLHLNVDWQHSTFLTMKLSQGHAVRHYHEPGIVARRMSSLS